eukprot:856250-Pleurochrysis_carterae.AAC.1
MEGPTVRGDTKADHKRIDCSRLIRACCGLSCCLDSCARAHARTRHARTCTCMRARSLWRSQTQAGVRTRSRTRPVLSREVSASPRLQARASTRAHAK